MLNSKVNIILSNGSSVLLKKNLSKLVKNQIKIFLIILYLFHIVRILHVQMKHLIIKDRNLRKHLQKNDKKIYLSKFLKKK